MVTDSQKKTRKTRERIVRGVPLSDYKILRDLIIAAKKQGINLTWDHMVQARLCAPAKRQGRNKFRRDTVRKLESILGTSLDRLLQTNKAAISE